MAKIITSKKETVQNSEVMVLNGIHSICNMAKLTTVKHATQLCNIADIGDTDPLVTPFSYERLLSNTNGVMAEIRNCNKYMLL